MVLKGIRIRINRVGVIKEEVGGRGVVLTTHRVSEDLKKHLLQKSEDEIEYGTNLDRNRYGTDTDYLHTCIRYNVNSLNLCEKLVNIEIIDCKGGITAAAAMNVSSNSSSSTRKKPMASTLVSSPSSCVRIVREGESKCRCGEINKEIQSMMERKEMFDPTQIVWPQIGKNMATLEIRIVRRTKIITTPAPGQRQRPQLILRLKP